MANKRTQKSQADASKSDDATVLPDILPAILEAAQDGLNAPLSDKKPARDEAAARAGNAQKEAATKPAAPKTTRKRQTPSARKLSEKKAENPKKTSASSEQKKTPPENQKADDPLTAQKTPAETPAAAKQTVQKSTEGSAAQSTPALHAAQETPAKKTVRKKRTASAKPKTSSESTPRKEPQKEKAAKQAVTKNSVDSSVFLQERSHPAAQPKQEPITPQLLQPSESDTAEPILSGAGETAETTLSAPESAQDAALKNDHQAEQKFVQESMPETVPQAMAESETDTLPQKAETGHDEGQKEQNCAPAPLAPAKTQEMQHPIISEATKTWESDRPAQECNSGEKPRRKKRHYTLPVFAAMTALIAASSVLFVYLLFTISNSALLRSRPDVDLPNFYGMTQEQVEDNREYDRFDIEFVPVYTNEANEGIIFSQTPKPPKQVKDNAHIVLRVSQGVRKVEIPTVTGLMREEAETLLKEKGVSVLIQPEVDETQEEGVVLRSEPVAGTVIKSGETVTLHVSRALVEQTSVVPDCVGKDRKEAQTLLQNLKLSISVKEVLSASPDGTVVSQSPKAGTVRQRGSAVTLEVASSTALDTNGGDHEHKFITKHIEPGPVSIGGDAHICEICGAVQWSNVLMPTG